MSKQHHYLKTLTHFYQDVESGKKNFEVRFNDRNFQIYDILHLQEFIPPNKYTGREITKEVSYILSDVDYCKEGYLIMGLKED